MPDASEANPFVLRLRTPSTLEATQGQIDGFFSVNSHSNITRIGWQQREIDLRFALGLPPGWLIDSHQVDRHIDKPLRRDEKPSPLCLEVLNAPLERSILSGCSSLISGWMGEHS